MGGCLSGLDDGIPLLGLEILQLLLLEGPFLIQLFVELGELEQKGFLFILLELGKLLV